MVSFHLAALVGAAVILLAAVGVFGWLPARASDDPRPPRTGARTHDGPNGADGSDGPGGFGGPGGSGGPDQRGLPSVTTDAVTGSAPVLPVLPDDLVPATEQERP